MDLLAAAGALATAEETAVMRGQLKEYDEKVPVHLASIRMHCAECMKEKRTLEGMIAAGSTAYANELPGLFRLVMCDYRAAAEFIRLVQTTDQKLPSLQASFPHASELTVLGHAVAFARQQDAGLDSFAQIFVTRRKNLIMYINLLQDASRPRLRCSRISTADARKRLLAAIKNMPVDSADKHKIRVVGRGYVAHAYPYPAVPHTSSSASGLGDAATVNALAGCPAPAVKYHIVFQDQGAASTPFLLD